MSHDEFIDEFVSLAARAGIDEECQIDFSDVLAWRHQTDERAYADVDADALVFRFAPAILELPPQHIRGLIAHELGHVLCRDLPGGGTEEDADEAARRVFGMTIRYDCRWPGKGLQRANPRVWPDEWEGPLPEGVDADTILEELCPTCDSSPGTSCYEDDYLVWYHPARILAAEKTVRRRNPVTPEYFATWLLEHAAQAPDELRFGRKVFLGPLLEDSGVSRQDFQALLLEANRRRLITLARADYVAAMDPELVRTSEFSDRGSDFHFVIDEGYEQQNPVEVCDPSVHKAQSALPEGAFRLTMKKVVWQPGDDEDPGFLQGDCPVCGTTVSHDDRF